MRKPVRSVDSFTLIARETGPQLQVFFGEVREQMKQKKMNAKRKTHDEVFCSWHCRVSRLTVGAFLQYDEVGTGSVDMSDPSEAVGLTGNCLPDFCAC